MVFILGLLGFQFKALVVRRIRKSPNSRIYSGGPNLSRHSTRSLVGVSLGSRGGALLRF